MANSTSNGGAFPAGNFGNALSAGVQVQRPAVSDAPAEAAHALDGLSGQLQHMALDAAGREGAAHAVDDVAAGKVVAQDDGTAFGAAFNATAKQSLDVQRKAVMSDAAQAAFDKNPENPGALTTALDAAKAGLGKTPYKDLDLALDAHFGVLRSHYLHQATEGAQRASQAAQAANFDSAANLGASTLTQVAAGAGLDPDGDGRMKAALNGYVSALLPYAPPQAFKIGDIDVPADASRTGQIAPADIAKRAQTAISKAKAARLTSAQRALTGSDAQARFADQARARYEAGDPLFTGMSPEDTESTLGKLDMTAEKSGNDERAARAEQAATVRQGIDALRYGGPVNRDGLLAAAKASGDAGLQAEAQFYLDADIAQPGILKRVVAAQLGLTGAEAGKPGVEWVDPKTGQPIPTGGSGSPRGLRNNNPTNLKVLSAGQKWAGQVGEDRAGIADGQPGFAVFDSPQSGMQAARQNLVARQTKYGLNTVQGIIGDPQHGWAPAADHNNVPAYVAAVSKALGVSPTTPIDLRDPHTQAVFMGAVVHQEVGGVVRGKGAIQPPPPGTPAYAAFANFQEGVAADPIKFLFDKQLAGVQPLVVEGALSPDPTQKGAWIDAMRRRAALGGVLDQYQAPHRLLANGEADYYKAQLQQHPDSVLGLAESASAALGPAAAVGFLREVGAGGEAPVAIHIGQLALTSPRFAALAAQGMRLEKIGAKEAPWKIQGDTWNKAQAAIAPALANAPEIMVAARRTAELAHVADSAQGVTNSPESYLAQALGAKSIRGGGMTGGVMTYNGAATYLPPWLNQGRVSDAVGALGKRWEGDKTGPLYGNGQPVKANEVAGARLIYRADGRYGLQNARTGQLLGDGHGRPFSFDFDAQRNWLVGQVNGVSSRP